MRNIKNNTKNSTKKYITPDNQIVEVGDHFYLEGLDFEFKPLEEKELEALLTLGLVKEYAPKKLTYSEVVGEVGKNLSWREIGTFIENLKSYPTAYLNVMLKAAAILIDKRYPDHISKSPLIWVYNTLTNAPAVVDKNKIASYNGFAAFRSREDLQEALEAINKGYSGE